MSQLSRKYHVDEFDKGCTPLLNVTNAITFEKLVSLFFTLGLGMTLAIFVWILEKIQWQRPSFQEKTSEDQEFETAIINFRVQLSKLTHHNLENHVMSSSILQLEKSIFEE